MLAIQHGNYNGLVRKWVIKFIPAKSTSLFDLSSSVIITLRKVDPATASISTMIIIQC